MPGNTDVTAQTMAYDALASMHPPTYRLVARVAEEAGTDPIRLTEAIVEERWCDAYRDLTDDERRSLTKDLVLACVHQLTARTN